jgi:hypothetical protein
MKAMIPVSQPKKPHFLAFMNSKRLLKTENQTVDR